MYDIHCHILPGLDDGAKSLEFALSMARQAVDEGIRCVVATPHHANGHYETSRDQILAEVSRLNQALEQNRIPLQVVPGQEIRLYNRLLDDLCEKNHEFVLVGGRYLLLELPSYHIPKNLSELIYELELQGITVIIAHPERNREIIEDPEKLIPFVKQGALAQITSHSLTGGFGRRVHKVSLQLCRQNLVHLVASDAHNLTTRRFMLKDSFHVVEKHCGQALADYFLENAEKLVRGVGIELHIPKKAKKYFLF